MRFVVVVVVVVVFCFLNIKYDPSKFIILPQDSFGTIRNEKCVSSKFDYQGVRGSKSKMLIVPLCLNNGFKLKYQNRLIP